MNKKIIIPGNVPDTQKARYINRYERITKQHDRIFMFAVDQKMQHLNSDFYGDNLPAELNNPEYLFQLATQLPISAFAAHLGLIETYVRKYPTLPYIIKLDGKTNLTSGDPCSEQLWSVADALELESIADVTVCGVGYTVYLGSDHEAAMLTHAAQMVQDAHRNGILALLWMYPRGHNVPDEHDANIIAGAAGVAASLGADVVKVQRPHGDASLLQQAVGAAGATKVIVSGGTREEKADFLHHVADEITHGGVAGVAVGRNLFQRPEHEALEIGKIIERILYNS